MQGGIRANVGKPGESSSRRWFVGMDPQKLSRTFSRKDEEQVLKRFRVRLSLFVWKRRHRTAHPFIVFIQKQM
jgi:hypothetical protein